MYDLHNYKLKFNMTHVNKFKGGREVKMKNWTAYHVKYKGYSIQVNPNSILIWSMSRYKTNDVDKTSREVILAMTTTAIDFCRENNIKIYEIPIPIGKEIKVLDYRVDGNFITPEVKAVYPTPSPVEFMGKNAENRAKDYVMNAKEIANAMTSWSQKMDFYASNYAAHVEAINNLNSAVVELKKTIGDSNDRESILSKLWSRMSRTGRRLLVLR